MKVRYGDIKRMIREEREYSLALQEIFGKKPDFAGILDKIMADFQNLGKEVEEAHKLAPQGAAKAIVAGIHSDLFNKGAEIRKYVEQLKRMAQGGGGGGGPQKKVAGAPG